MKAAHERSTFGRFRYIRVGVLAALVGMVLTACTAVGGGVLAPTPLFNARANTGFSFRCENSKLHISIAYQERGASAVFGGPFSIHGVADEVPDEIVAAYCAGDAQNEALPVGRVVFEGVYRTNSGSLNGYKAKNCSDEVAFVDPLTGASGKLKGCRFTADVFDTGAAGPSKGDTLTLTLFGGALTTGPQAVPIYSRFSTLESGNFRVQNP